MTILTPDLRDYPRTYIERISKLFIERQLKTIVEIGCMRMPMNHKLDELNIDCCMDGHSSIYWASLTETGDFVSVDINSGHMHTTVQEIKRHLGTPFQGIIRDGIDYLRHRRKPIDLLYLDAFDADQPDSAENHLKAFKAAEKLLHDKSLVLIDDTDCKLVDGVLHLSETGLEGKGALVIPYATENGWKVLFSGRQTALSK